ncbi:unnamed protein product, partial [Adineta steineri]
AALMNKHYDDCPDPPRVLGLTASITNKKIKCKDLMKHAQNLKETYRAEIVTRDESIQHGTSVHVETIPCPSYKDEILKKNESLIIPFDILRYMVNIIQNYLVQKKDQHIKIERELSHTMLNTDYLGVNLTDYQNQSSDYTDITQSRPITLQLFKHYLENLIEVGYELGLCGLLIFAKELRKKLRKNQGLTLFPDQEARNIFSDIYQRLECLTDDILKNLYQLNVHDSDILFSPKVLQLLDRILKQPNTEGTLGQSIVFVERVYTATILSQVLSHLILTLESSHAKQLKVNHVTGIKSLFYDKSMTMKYQEKTIKEFRSGVINILIATAVVEEGLDIPRCDLVIRFNKPNNFSSYMQSKGRARAKQNAAYVLFLDELDIDSCQRDQMEYENYEEIEK